jgi:hypothetical protein
MIDYFVNMEIIVWMDNGRGTMVKGNNGNG